MTNESVSAEPYTAKGSLSDLFDPTLLVLSTKTAKPGEQACLYNIWKVSIPQTLQVLAAAASRVYDEKVVGHRYSFIAKSPAKTTDVMRILLPCEPNNITVTGANGNEIPGIKSSWDSLGKTIFLRFENSPNGIKIATE